MLAGLGLEVPALVGQAARDRVEPFAFAVTTLPDGWAIVEHLPVSQIAQAKRHLTERAKALGIDIR